MKVQYIRPIDSVLVFLNNFYVSEGFKTIKIIGPPSRSSITGYLVQERWERSLIPSSKAGGHVVSPTNPGIQTGTQAKVDKSAHSINGVGGTLPE